MKKSIAIGLTLLFIVSMAGCSLYGVASDYPAAIMVGDTVYYLTSQAMPAEIDKSAVIGYTESYTDAFPKENNATNFNRELNMPIAKVENGVAVLYENEWRFCTPESSAYEDASAKTGNTSVLKEPPQLTILYADEGITALRGTYSWTYQDEDKTFMGIESDSLHPLQSKEYMPSLHLTRSTLSHIEPFSDYLQFETVPNQLTVCCWSVEQWDHIDAESEAVAVSKYDGEADQPVFQIPLKEGSFIYEVVATWENAEAYGGTAHYSFYTEPGTIDASVKE